MASRIIIFVFSFLFAIHLCAQTLLEKAGKDWFDPLTAPPVGIETEVRGIQQQKVSALLHEFLGGEVQIETVTNTYYSKRGKPIQVVARIYRHYDTVIGNFKVIIDDNGASINSFKMKNIVTEIVTDPLNYEQVLLFNDAVELLHERGAKGASKSVAVANQFNVQFGDGVHPESIRAGDIIKRARAYLRPEHRVQIAQELKVVDVRQKYLGFFTPGMMERFMDESYNPTEKQLYNDFMYRQALEHFGYSQAWNLEMADVIELVKTELTGNENSFERILPIMKWNYIRLSSVMIFLFPNEWMSRFLMDSMWAFKPYPIAEIREPNSNKKVASTYRSVVGLMQEAERQGNNFVYVGPLRLKKNDRMISTYVPLTGAAASPRCGIVFN